MIWHCIHCSFSADENCALTVYSPDTGVACLLLAFKKNLMKHVYLDTGWHVISIDNVFRSIGDVQVNALLSLHGLPGSVTTGRFIGKEKTLWNVFRNCSREHLDAISSIHSEKPLEQLSVLEDGGSQHSVLPHNYVQPLCDARWHLFKKCSDESERLPPTTGAFKQAVLRAHSPARTWRLNNKFTRNP